MIQAKVIADSLSPQGNRITSMIVTMPRFILAEFNTHRMFSRNSASSRAIPFKKMVDMVDKNPFVPIAWQKDHPGMQGTEYLNSSNLNSEAAYNDHIVTWLMAKNNAIKLATQLNECKVTKQLCNRLLEPFMYHTVLVTSTEWDNFWQLRCPQYQRQNGLVFRSWKDLVKSTFNSGANRDVVDELENYSILDRLKLNKGQAEIHMMDVAEKMWDAYNESIPRQLAAGEWHIPFGNEIDGDKMWEELKSRHTSENENQGFGIYGVKIAIARCARVSYLTFDGKNDYNADVDLYNRLATSGHWSPFEHCARAMSRVEYIHHLQGTFSVDSKYVEFSGQGGGRTETYINGEKGFCKNFRGFIQARHLIENNLPF